MTKAKTVIEMPPSRYEKEAFDKMSLAKMTLINSLPFFAPILVVLEFVLIKDKMGSTMATDGHRIYFSPKFVLEHSFYEILFVIVHELCHIILFHNTRRKERDHFIWNLACDYAINPMVKEMTYYNMPDSALIDDRFKDLNAEMIYEELTKRFNELIDNAKAWEKEKGEEIGDPDYKRPGCVIDLPESKNRAVVKKYENDLKKKISDVVKRGKKAGTIPGNLISTLEDLVKPKLNWKSILNTYMEPDQSDYSWNRPNRRFIHMGLYLPAKSGESIGEIVLAIDTSASLEKEEHIQFMSEFMSIINSCRPTNLHYLQIDTEVAFSKTYTDEDYPLIKFPDLHGGGGTSFSPAFSWLKERNINPRCLIYMTDLYSDDFGDKPHYPVLWINTSPGSKNQKDVPWGKVLDIEIGDTA